MSLSTHLMEGGLDTMMLL